jgi:hypothetical protein
MKFKFPTEIYGNGMVKLWNSPNLIVILCKEN